MSLRNTSSNTKPVLTFLRGLSNPVEEPEVLALAPQTPYQEADQDQDSAVESQDHGRP